MVAGFVDPCFRDDQFAVSRTLLATWITDIHALQGALVALPSNGVAVGRDDGLMGPRALELNKNEMIAGGHLGLVVVPAPPSTGEYVMMANPPRWVPLWYAGLSVAIAVRALREDEGGGDSVRGAQNDGMCN